jgi:hypothetical protein
MSLTASRADALLPLISKIESTLSELNYHIGETPTGPHFDPSRLRDIEIVLNRFWDQCNDICNATSAALDSDGPSPRLASLCEAIDQFPEAAGFGPDLESL